MFRLICLCPVFCFWLISPLRAADPAAPSQPVKVTFLTEPRPGQPAETKTVEAEVVVEARDGGLLLRDRAGRLWPVTPPQIESREPLTGPFVPLTQQQMADELKAEFGEDGEIIFTPHYVIYAESGFGFARWTGSLFERLLAAFKTHWNRRPLSVTEPRFPLVVIVLKDQQRYAEYAVKDAGPSALEALGYYSLLTNRVVIYDLTAGGPPPRNELDLLRRLVGQTQNVSTIIHEATHQIAFNSGLHVRLADNPIWLVEGMAMYFETPDLKNASGWRTVGQLNEMRMRDYKEYFSSRRGADAFRSMIVNDERFQNADTALDAYAEAWALTYFLIKTKREAYVRYLQELAEKKVLEQDEPDARLKLFEEMFGPLPQVEKEFFRYMDRAAR